ncbi:MAG: hypothetical protein ACXVNO_00220 [Bacteroidia bacterium]
MKLFGKDIPAEKINFITNVVSFVIGAIFFIRMQCKLNEVPAPPSFNSERDSLVTIQARIDTQLKEIKTVQDSLVKVIAKDKAEIKSQDKQIAVQRTQLHATVHSNWETLSRPQQDAYINQIFTNLKKQKSP